MEVNAIHNTGSTQPLATIGSATIQLKPDAQPVIQGARKLAFRLHDPVAKELDRMVAKGIIERVTGPTKWLSPIVVARRKNGKPRICGDFRRLNESIRRERFVIPPADTFFANLHGAKVFSTLDLESGFNQIGLDTASADLTMIATHRGNYHYLRLPFGISSAPEIFQRIMADHLADLEGCLVYIDDILVVGKDIDEHNRRLKAVLARIKMIGAKLNQAKCKYAQRKLVYLGHTISEEGVSPDTEKISEALSMDPPSTVGEARRILGMLNYLQRFCLIYLTL
ncbi:MAG: reverse transcriptase family protein [Pseudomonadota bacterium]